MSTSEEHPSFEVVRSPSTRPASDIFYDQAGEETPCGESGPEEHEVKVLKRQAVGIVMTWLGSPQAVKASEDRGYCLLRFKVRGVWRETRATSWWACLRAVHAYLVELGIIQVEPAPTLETPERGKPSDYSGIPFSADPFAEEDLRS